MQIDVASPTKRAPTHAVFIVLPRFNLTTLITMIETMRIANYLSSELVFSWEIFSFDGPRISASNGMNTQVNDDVATAHTADFIFVLGSWGTEVYDNKRLTSWLRKEARAGRRIAAVELGCYVIARAGLLDGKKATTHFSWLSGFRESFPQVEAIEQVFTIDGKIMTCSGGLAGVDLMLHLIDEILGSGLSGEVSDQMLYPAIRVATTEQRRTMGRSKEEMLPLVRRAMSIIEQNIEEPLSVPAIAKALNVSQRQLERQFGRHVGCTVVQFGLLRRVENARILLISTQMSVREIATASGFNTLSHFSYSFGKLFGRRPSEYREAWPENEPAPSWTGTLSDFVDALERKRQQKAVGKSPRLPALPLSVH